ncbi:hypothetical protein [Halarcobacter sp.]|uniref:hypothetical protein n=1 Tax=Halarcobacter sp. TaxID=2321133 RepID=UPI0029F4C4E7|nr:hypothetical protein [Halarcobacter sp.]
MANEKIARLSSATISFLPLGETEAIILGYQQSVNLARSSEKKELLSNDENVEESVVEIDTKATYEFTTEIGDLNLTNLALAFKGLVEEITYEAGDIFPTGKTIRAKDEAAAIGELILDDTGTKIHIATEDITAGAFDVAKCANRTYPATVKKLKPEAKKNNFGKIIVDGVNLATDKAQILVIPSINLSFDGDFAISGSDFAKISLKGKCLKKDGENLFELYDA